MRRNSLVLVMLVAVGMVGDHPVVAQSNPPAVAAQPAPAPTPPAPPPPAAKCQKCQDLADQFKELRRIIDNDLFINDVNVDPNDALTRLRDEISRVSAELAACKCNTPTTASLFRKPWVRGGIAAGATAVVGGLLWVSGGDDNPSIFASPAPLGPPSTTTNPAAPPPVTPPPVTSPPPPVDFAIDILLGWDHPLGSRTSIFCGTIRTNPAQPGAPFTGLLTGVGVIPGQNNVSGALNPSGVGVFQAPINQAGPVTIGVAVTAANNLVRTETKMINVTGDVNRCP